MNESDDFLRDRLRPGQPGAPAQRPPQPPPRNLDLRPLRLPAARSATLARRGVANRIGFCPPTATH